MTVAFALQLSEQMAVMVRFLMAGPEEPAMIAYVVKDGRLLSLKPSEWLMLIAGAMLCGYLTLLF